MNPLGNHSGSPASSDRGPIDKPWSFFDNTGHHFTAGNGITDNGDGTLNMSNWRWGWNGIPEINLGGGLQDCGTTSDGICVVNILGGGTMDVGGLFDMGTGLGAFNILGTYYTMDYSVQPPLSDASGFGGVPISLHLEGRIISVVPEPSSLLLIGSGLVGLFGILRRKK